MTTEEKKSPEAPNTARNVIIGVLTTVLVSTIVYFLGFAKPKNGPTKLEIESATINAWTAYLNLDNNYAKSAALLIRDIGKVGGYKEVFFESKKESEEFAKKLEKLMEDKNIDKDMMTVFKRRLKNEENMMPAVEKFYFEMDTIVKIAEAKEWEEKQFMDSLIACQGRYQGQFKGMMDRAIVEVEELAKTLSERYQRPFNSDDFYIIQMHKHGKDIMKILQEDKNRPPTTRESLIGKWDASGSTVMLYADSKWSWFVPADSSSSEGTWELKDGQLFFNVEKNSKSVKKGTWGMELIDVAESAIILKLTVPPNTIYTFVRK